MTVSSNWRTQSFAAETGVAPVFLLTLIDAVTSETVRLTDHQTDLVSSGNTYLALAFEIAVPDESDVQPQVTLRIDNVDRRIVDFFRAQTSPPAISLSVVLAETPDLIESGPFDMRLRDAEYDALSVTATLAFENVLMEPFPGDSFVPSHYTGLF